MAYVESRLPSTAKKKTSKGATKAVRKSAGLSAAPTVAPVTGKRTPSISSAAPSKAARRVARAQRQRVKTVKSLVAKKPPKAPKPPRLDIRGRRPEPKVPRLELAKAAPKVKQVKGKAPRTPKQKTREVFVGPKASKQVRQRVAKRLKKVAVKAQPKPKAGLSGPLTPGQVKFGKTLAKKTGLSPRVIGAWELAEESSTAAQEKEASGYHNWLNIGPFIQAPEFSNPKTAAKATAKFLKGKPNPAGAAGANIPSIVTAAGKPEAEQMRTIEQSGWSATGYGAGGTLAGTYGLVKGKSAPKAKPKSIPRKLTKQAERVLGERRTAKIVSKAAAPEKSMLSGATKLKPDQRSTLKAMVKEATKIDKANKPYVYGGGHVAGKVPGINKTNYDCSSVTSRILQKAGVLPKSSGALVSGDFMNYGAPGPGTVTIFANEGHVFMRIGNKYFGTSSQDQTGSGGFLRESTGAAEAASGKYTVRHVPELGKAKIGLKGLPSFPGVSLSDGGTTATVTSSTTLDTPGSSTKPMTPAKRKAKRIEGRKRSQTIRKLIAEGPTEVPVSEAERTTTPYEERVRKVPVKLGL